VIDGKRILAVIPARSGSKGLVGKNTRIICGQPLIYWSVVNARSSQLIDTILVSTDDPSIRSIGLEFGAEAPFLRPDVLAADDTPTVAVIEHAIEFYKTQEKTLFEKRI
jgi:CMP-N,N'-diacetyllegionaminic acid synthase